MNIVLLFSGGIDSTVLLYELKAEGNHLACLTVDYGQRHAKEIAGARKIARMNGCQHRILDLSAIGTLLKGSRSSLVNPTMEIPEGHYEAESMKATVVPNRNMILLAAAAAWAIGERFDAVAYAAHRGDHAIYPDCRKEFAEAMDRAISLADWHHLKVLYPFVDLRKLEIVSLGVELEVPFAMTWSCYRGGSIHCGRCGTCTERREAFALAGVDDPTEYTG